jgi:Spy/CpxP family protein refolding chaperone
MKTTINKSVLIWVIVILVATNLSTVGSFYYHKISEGKEKEVKTTEQTVVPGEQRTRFFRDQLNLDDNQLNEFREINRTFNRTARDIEISLSQLRKEIVDELGATHPDSIKLDSLAREIGNDHHNLKQVTTRYYLDMKKICTPEQQARLYEIFQSMLNKENQVNLPQPGFQRGKGRNR